MSPCSPFFKSVLIGKNYSSSSSERISELNFRISKFLRKRIAHIYSIQYILYSKYKYINIISTVLFWHCDMMSQKRQRLFQI